MYDCVTPVVPVVDLSKLLCINFMLTSAVRQSWLGEKISVHYESVQGVYGRVRPVYLVVSFSELSECYVNTCSKACD